MEEQIFLEGTSRNPRGQMFTNGPGNYKIPAFSDVPIELNVSLLKGSPNKRAIYSSRVIICYNAASDVAKLKVVGIGGPSTFISYPQNKIL